MVNTTILRVGNSYRVKFAGHALASSSFTDGYFTLEELDELRQAIQHVQAQIGHVQGAEGSTQQGDQILAAYNEQLRGTMQRSD